ncbi:MAG: DNA recombination protein RmuC [Spirochaetaceae bacterium]|nr:DNA recombination protein RmuC [Spirochaetaceae bacterium]
MFLLLIIILAVLALTVLLLPLKIWQSYKAIKFSKAELIQSNAELTQLKADYTVQFTKIAVSEAKEKALLADNLALKAELKELALTLKTEATSMASYKLHSEIELAKVKTREAELIKKEQQIKEQFENLARQVLEDSANKLSEHNKARLSEVISPFKEKLNEFHKKVDDVYVKEGQERVSLKKEIELLAERHKELGSQAENLAKALKGDNKQQGNWGEMQLQRILEVSGLDKNVDYILQADVKNEDNKTQRPDVIIKLPEDKHIVIDSKVNLLYYEQYINSNSERDQADYLNQFIKSVKEQINNLSSKDYHASYKLDGYKLDSPEFTIMFMPIESAYSLAISKDYSLHDFAWSKKIVLVSSLNLFALLKTISYGIANYKKTKESEKIAELGIKLYDKFAGFAEEMVKIEVSLTKAQDAYKEAFKKLTENPKNMVYQVEKLRKTYRLPVKKNLPATFTQQDDNGEEDEAAIAAPVILNLFED